MGENLKKIKKLKLHVSEIELRPEHRFHAENDSCVVYI